MNRREQFQDIAKLYDAEEFEIEEALYWWCNDHHSGQWSEEYGLLSTSMFRPGRLANGPDDEIAKMLYDAVCISEGCTHGGG